MTGKPFTRRDFLRLTAGGATLLATGAGCGSGSDKPRPSGATTSVVPESGRTLRIAQWSHFVPAYDEWFDGEYAKRWGERNDVGVTVDHFPLAELSVRADTEVTSQQGHDIFGFVYPPAAFEDQVIDHREIVEEVERKLGGMSPLIKRSIFNPRTGKFFGFSDTWAADPANYRTDLWDQVQPGFSPDTWEKVLRAGPKLKALGHPLGIGMSEEDDSNLFLLDLMHSFGASVQDEGANVTINRPSTIEAVKMGAAIYQAGMTDEIFAWDAASNNRFLTSGKGSLILNAVSALRAIEGQQPDLAAKIQLARPPAGPVARVGLYHVISAYAVWKFSKNQEVAKRFLVDLAVNARDAFVRSGFYNLPSFPKAIPDLEALVGADQAQPAGKYAVLSGAADWSGNLGHPGHANAAVEEVFTQYLIPKMFAAVARREMSAEDAVKTAEAKIKPIYDKWREREKI